MTDSPFNDDNMDDETEDEGPPKPYNTWDEYFENFDYQLENSPPITVRQRIGNPQLRLADEIPDLEIQEELDALLELLDQNTVSISFLHEISDREAYIFITEELLSETMDDVRIPDMFSCFIYEDFHPNDEDDIELWTREFLDAFFEEGTEAFFLPIGDKELYDAEGCLISVEEFKKQIDDFHALYYAVTEFKHEIVKLIINGDYANVEVNTSWAGLSKSEQAVVRYQGLSGLRLKRSFDIGWDVIQAKIVGWNYKL